jgi:hypothetical protein
VRTPVVHGGAVRIAAGIKIAAEQPRWEVTYIPWSSVGAAALSLLRPGRTPVPFAILRPDPLAYLVFNTISNLTTQDSQVDCFRYVWPAELDLMAQLAGLRLRERWSDWTRTPLTSASTGHVSVWEKPPAGVTSRGSNASFRWF